MSLPWSTQNDHIQFPFLTTHYKMTIFFLLRWFILYWILIYIVYFLFDLISNSQKVYVILLKIISQRSKLNKNEALWIFFSCESLSPQDCHSRLKHHTASDITQNYLTGLKSIVCCLDHKGIPMTEMLIDWVIGEPSSSTVWVGPCHQTQRGLLETCHSLPCSFLSLLFIPPVIPAFALFLISLVFFLLIICHQYV